MTTEVTLYTYELNIDYLLQRARIAFGDLTGKTYSDTVIRTALVSAVAMLESRWDSKYQVFDSSMVIADNGDGTVVINSAHGIMNVPDNLVNGDIFRSAYLQYTQDAPPIIES